MRVITGSAKGVKLQTLPGEATRPTVGRVKEGLFSAIQFDIEGRRVLDLFAGSGALGIEALSRGAAGCVFVDSSREAAAVIRQNLQNTRLSDNAQVITRDAASFLAADREQYDLALLDPPYTAGILSDILSKLASRMAKGGIIAAESDAKTALPDIPGLALDKTYVYGRVKIWKFIVD